jgi:hypothetical protein
LGEKTEEIEEKPSKGKPPKSSNQTKNPSISNDRSYIFVSSHSVSVFEDVNPPENEV